MDPENFEISYKKLSEKLQLFSCHEENANTIPDDSDDSSSDEPLHIQLYMNNAELLQIRTTQLKLMKTLMAEIEKKQMNVRICKSVFSGIGTIGAVLLFTPVAPLAAILGGAAATGGVGTALGDYFHGQKQAEELKNTLELSRECEDSYSVCKKKIEFQINLLVASGMSAEVAGLSVLSGVKMASNGVLNATKLSVGAIDIIEGAFKISFPAINAATRTGLRIAGSVIGAMAAAFDIADMIYSWVTVEPNLTKAIEITERLAEVIDNLNEEKKWIKAVQLEIADEFQELENEEFFDCPSE